jgi:hypothetical protein
MVLFYHPFLFLFLSIFYKNILSLDKKRKDSRKSVGSQKSLSNEEDSQTAIFMYTSLFFRFEVFLLGRKQDVNFGKKLKKVQRRETKTNIKG